MILDLSPLIENIHLTDLKNKFYNIVHRRPTERGLLLRVAGQPLLLLPVHGPHLRPEGPVHPEARARPAREGGRRAGERGAGAALQGHPEGQRDSPEEDR